MLDMFYSSLLWDFSSVLRYFHLNLVLWMILFSITVYSFLSLMNSFFLSDRSSTSNFVCLSSLWRYTIVSRIDWLSFSSTSIKVTHLDGIGSISTKFENVLHIFICRRMINANNFISRIPMHPLEKKIVPLIKYFRLRNSLLLRTPTDSLIRH